MQRANTETGSDDEAGTVGEPAGLARYSDAHLVAATIAAMLAGGAVLLLRVAL